MEKSSDVGNRIWHGTIVIVLVGIFAKLAAFIVEAILAAYLGTTFTSDAYYMVSSIQQVIYPMLSVGIWKVFLPIYKDKLARNDLDGTTALANRVITFFTIASIIAAVILAVCSNGVVAIVAPGFQGKTRALCAQLVRISAPMYVFIIAAAVYASMLQCHDKFFGSQIREVVTHIPTIIIAVFFYQRYGVQALAVALVIGSILRLAVEFRFVDWGYRFKANFNFRCEEFSLIWRRLPSALISEGVTQLNTLVDKIMASSLPEGTVSGLNYGNKLMNVFSGLLSSAVATAVYPQMIELIVLHKKRELCDLLTNILNIFSLLMIPITVACILFRTDLVTAVYARGSFGKESVELTAGIFAFYSLGYFFVACNTVVNNIFYSFGDTRTPMTVSVVNLVCNAVLNVVMLHLIGVNGLPLATSLSAVITAFLRLFLLRKTVELEWRRMLALNLKIILISILSCAVPRAVVDTLNLNVYGRLMAAAALGVVLYLGMLFLAQIHEIKILLRMIRKKR